MKHILRPRSFGMLVLVLILAAAVYGFAAANTVPDSYAGDGSGTIYGYEVCSLTYSIYGDSDPSNIEQVSFVLHDVGSTCSSPANASQVYISFASAAPWNWVDCSPAGPASSITCSGLTQTVLGAAALRVIASN
jgi:hypothetical protein